MWAEGQMVIALRFIGNLLSQILEQSTNITNCTNIQCIIFFFSMEEFNNKKQIADHFVPPNPDTVYSFPGTKRTGEFDI